MISARIKLGKRLASQRATAGKTQAEVASAAEISTGYYSEIESGNCAPPMHRITKILGAIGFDGPEIRELEQLAAEARGQSREDVDLPEDVQLLIRDIRKYARTMSPRFVRGLRTKIREAVS